MNSERLVEKRYSAAARAPQPGGDLRRAVPRGARRDGHRMERGRRYPVCDKTYQLDQQEPYRAHFALVDPHPEISLTDAKLFDCAGARLRHPRETKGAGYRFTSEAAHGCDSGNGACC